MLDQGEKGEGPENPYGVVDGSYANFYEKALFVKPTWRLYVVTERNSCSALRAMLLFALVVSLLSSDSVHTMRSLFSGSTEVLQSSERSFLLLEGWTKFAWRSHLMLDPKRIRAIEAVLCLPSGSSL